MRIRCRDRGDFMRAFIFDKYGYYPDQEDAIQFEQDGWIFKLEIVQKQTEEEIQSLDTFVDQLAGLFPNFGVRIIPNRNGAFISETDFGKVALVAIKKRYFSLQELAYIHQQYLQSNPQEKFTITQLMELWEEKVNVIEEKAIPTIKIDDYAYERIMVATIHAIGLAENAIQYLAELKIDYGDEIENLTLCHRRLSSLESECVLNPFHFILDNAIRDLAELFKARKIPDDLFLENLSNYPLQAKEAGLLFARIIFPTYLFDLLETHYSDRIDVRSQILSYYRSLPEWMVTIQKVERYLVEHYGIRPISWLQK